MGEKGLKEISLGELAGILWRRRLLVIIIMIASLLISLAYAFFIAAPVYEAGAEIGVMSVNTGVSSFDEANSPKVLASILSKEVSGSEFINKLRKELESNGTQVNRAALKSAVSATLGKDGKTIFVQVKYKNKEELVPIVNAVVNILGREASSYLVDQIQQQIVITENQIKLGKAKSNEALSKYEVYTSSPNSSSSLQSDVDIAEALLVQLKANLISDNFGPNKSKKQLEQEIAKLEEEVRLLSEKLVDASSQDSLYQEELDSSLEIYKALNEEYNRLKFAKIYYTDNSNLELLSGPVEPVEASWPDKKLMVLVSLVLSICVAFSTAFIIERYKLKK